MISLETVEFLLDFQNLVERTKFGIGPYSPLYVQQGDGYPLLENGIVFDVHTGDKNERYKVVQYVKPDGSVDEYWGGKSYAVYVWEDEEHGRYLEVVIDGVYAIGVQNGEIMYTAELPKLRHCTEDSLDSKALINKDGEKVWLGDLVRSGVQQAFEVWNQMDGLRGDVKRELASVLEQVEDHKVVDKNGNKIDLVKAVLDATDTAFDTWEGDGSLQKYIVSTINNALCGCEIIAQSDE